MFCEDFCGVFDCDGITAYAPCILTQAGLFRLTGPIEEFIGCEQQECIQSIHIPSGIPQFALGADPTQRRGDKPSSLLAIKNRLYWFGHQLMVEPRYGYVAYSEDKGKTWTEVPDSPWTGDSHFRVLMVINMGQDYALNQDGYIYGLGIHGELIWPPAPQQVYLTRVHQDSILRYQSYQYFAGLDKRANPLWSVSQADAVPLAELNTIALGAAMYHPGGRTVCFSCGFELFRGACPNALCR
ncbi:MAG: DUF4185 domain-containing protein [candidate division KSB1 bacterium]|nr:DUF4185 domain-containing protein [candidate division KSB1 bacterium]